VTILFTYTYLHEGSFLLGKIPMTFLAWSVDSSNLVCLEMFENCVHFMWQMLKFEVFQADFDSFGGKSYIHNPLDKLIQQHCHLILIKSSKVYTVSRYRCT